MKPFSSFLILILFSTFLCCQETSPEFDPVYAQKLRLKLANIGAVYDLEGLSAAVFVPGQGIWVGTWGKGNATDQVTPDMRFGIASNSKAVIAALMLKLQEEGLIDLDDPLHEYLPVYQNIHPNITIRQLLTHTSGLFDFLNDWTTETSNAYASNPDSVWTFEDLIRTIGPPHELPGKRYRYSNTNFLLAGMIAEAVTNLSIREVLQTRIFGPLNLDMIYPVGANVFSAPYSNVFSGTTPILEPGHEDTFLSFTATAGAIWSTAYDMVRWYDALFGRDWLSPESQFELRDNDGYNPYGLGIRLANRYGTSYYHHGGVWGFRSYMIHDTRAGISVCLLSNKFGFPVSAAARSFFRRC
jgi:D-alanyl-D-alanine carboxypeptidase